MSPEYYVDEIEAGGHSARGRSWCCGIGKEVAVAAKAVALHHGVEETVNMDHSGPIHADSRPH